MSEPIPPGENPAQAMETMREGMKQILTAPKAEILRRGRRARE